MQVERMHSINRMPQLETKSATVILDGLSLNAAPRETG